MTEQRPPQDSPIGPDDEGSVYDISAPTPPAGIALGVPKSEPAFLRPKLVDGNLDLDAPAPDELVQLADGLGVATEFKDWKGKQVPVATRTICGVLEALDMPVRTGVHVRAALAELRRRPWMKMLPDVTVVREGDSTVVPVHIDAELPLHRLEVRLETEDGSLLTLPLAADQPAPDEARATFDGRTLRRVNFLVLSDIPIGYHTLWARYQPQARHPGSENPAATDETFRPFIVTPRRLELPAPVAESRAWGFMTQLYSVRSSRSWGLGDLGDLAELTGWSARAGGADFVLVNPLHAAEPIAPMTPSPYLPTTRRFFNPVYLRVEDIPEVAYLASTERAIIEWQAEAMRALNTDPRELDRDAVWEAKSAALQTVFEFPRSRERQASFEAYCVREGQGLEDFATWSALAERYGLPAADWPAHLRDPHGEAVAHVREELADRVEFHRWLQWCLDQQLARVAEVARDAGMSVGVVHDLAVGVHPDGADAWALSDVLAMGVTAGAPPDAFNQQGQDWSQPPWRPDRLAELGYAPYRDMLRTLLRHAGALRIDHILGLFRFWWVPEGNSPADGTYVRYDHEAMIGLLALEAQRAGCFVVGEDLGNVEPSAREYLKERSVLGTSILWFERNYEGDGKPLPPEAWRELCLATVTTHDLPPTAGYLAGEHIELRERLGLLTRTYEQEAAIDAAERQDVLTQLTRLGLLKIGPTERDKVEALHVFLTMTPSKLIGVQLADAVGDRRTMNQPGTNDEYPNWRLPMADGVGQPVLLDDLMDSARVLGLVRTIDSRLHPNDWIEPA
ncbi:4-alpha-glucanotransferase [Kineosporia sp. J2-2]|uniref:4-alpha-glucanotransferase n=1 Tax=Kineosporia corallincola TaxID=2835133 RepID=A0ABS5TML5_9ACTN|nr:4-alpha-glucanotransferase [Kineosporia corallincola]MBT0772240.1 4-alpha-glucanotransferase [Kineosporia corallincola]